VDPSVAQLPPDERARGISRTAATLASLLGYELGSDDGDGLSAALDHACAGRIARGAPLVSLRDVSDELASRDAADFPELGRFLAARKLRQAMQRLARLDVGTRRRLFHDGYSIDVDRLLGHDEGDPARTRVSVIYLNALEQQEDKELVVASLADQLYRWMLAHPSQDLQALFYIDEVAPFIPPVRKPSCKQGLSLLFKQARKYGLGCLMATQNPGDVDYKAMAQFGTWAIGRLTTRQDRKKVEPTISSLAGDASEDVMDELPRLRAGQFVLLSPDHLAAPAPLTCRWLFTAHETFDERRIRDAAERLWRDRFPPPKTAPEPAPAPRPATAVPAPEPQPAPKRPEPEPAPKPPESAPQRTETGEASWERILVDGGAMDAKVFAERMGVSPGTARRRAKRLVEMGLAAAFQRGRATLYWATRSGLRPDIGLEHDVVVAGAPVQQAQAQAIAERHRRTPVLGIGSSERIAQLTMMHLPLIHVPFDEQVTRSLLERALGSSHDHLRGSVYLHPTDLRYLVFDASKGLSFAPRPADYASRVEDLDGAVTWHAASPTSLQLDEAAWSARRSLDEGAQRVRNDFPSAKPGAPSYVFLPYWHLVLEQDGGANYRVVDLDPIAGQPFTRGV
jgi:hypothetical protein